MAGVIDTVGGRTVIGDADWQVGIASVSKLIVGYAALIALEEGSVSLDDPAGPEGASLRDLLAHSSGLAFDSPKPIAPPRTRRIYSNTGIEAAAAEVERATSMPFEDYLQMGVIEPLGMGSTELRGSPAHGIVSSVDDLLRFAGELLDPHLVGRATLDLATRPHHPELSGMLPGVGRMDPNPWGLAFEIKGDKHPHWTGAANSSRTFGHFGGSGTFLWVDPDAGVACVALTDHRFGPWALEAWPDFSDAVLTQQGHEPFRLGP